MPKAVHAGLGELRSRCFSPDAKDTPADDSITDLLFVCVEPDGRGTGEDPGSHVAKSAGERLPNHSSVDFEQPGTCGTRREGGLVRGSILRASDPERLLQVDR